MSFDYLLLVMIYLMGFLYFVAGLYHFINPRFYLKIMPPYLKYHMPLIYISGAVEVISGIGILFEPSRALSAWLIILLLIAIYPANLYMWTARIKIGKKVIPQWAHVLRLFGQIGLILWAYQYTN